MRLARPRNDPRQYDDLVDEWWKPGGAFAALHWLAEARAQLIPPAARPDAILLDAGCGGGLLAHHVRGYRHIGVDLSEASLAVAAKEGITPIRGDAAALPVASGAADVVVAGELLEHVPDLPGVVAELARVLRPGGTVVIDTLSDSWWSRFSLVTVAEHLPGGPPRGIHDPALFVNPARLTALFAGHGIRLRVRGLRPSAPHFLRFLVDRDHFVPMLPTRSLASVFQGVGTKAPA